ncbi:HD domain-containing protein [Thermoanaerobacterium sp. RBIITD]|uniref:HD domain-containing protein n=1 Tax=Thermoanaerobacterium sp. RBIITD TaxID=1550240 RepID=UPI000BB7E281|nr:HD domain-containing protein [Thermoanaerobacterium sp. RBIITD]SNX53183.1 putative hydrolases of HD superfamily [Thermoanaerobacterium sp. RBIITD]
MDSDRLKKQIEFIVEIDKIKQVFRQTLLMDGSRHENDAEHSWHLAMMAMLLSEYTNEKVDVCHVIKMVMVHDIVEIDAGDTFVYDEKGYLDKSDREKKAADRIFNILPDDQAKEIRALWEEFEERKTPDAKYASALDRIQPILHNYYTKGHSWKEHGVKSYQVLERNKIVSEIAPELWKFINEILEDSIKKGYIER